MAENSQENSQRDWVWHLRQYRWQKDQGVPTPTSGPGHQMKPRHDTVPPFLHNSNENRSA
jgi:hypothetical protein